MVQVSSLTPALRGFRQSLAIASAWQDAPVRDQPCTNFREYMLSACAASGEQGAADVSCADAGLFPFLVEAKRHPRSEWWGD